MSPLDLFLITTYAGCFGLLCVLAGAQARWAVVTRSIIADLIWLRMHRDAMIRETIRLAILEGYNRADGDSFEFLAAIRDTIHAELDEIARDPDLFEIATLARYMRRPGVMRLSLTPTRPGQVLPDGSSGVTGTHAVAPDLSTLFNPRPDEQFEAGFDAELAAELVARFGEKPCLATLAGIQIFLEASPLITDVEIVLEPRHARAQTLLRNLTARDPFTGSPYISVAQMICTDDAALQAEPR